MKTNKIKQPHYKKDRDRMAQVLRCEHVDKPVFLVLSDEDENKRFGSLSQAKGEIKRRQDSKDTGIQVWADYGDKEVLISQGNWKENKAIVEHTIDDKWQHALAAPPFQLVLIDNNGRQMIFRERDEVFSIWDFAAVNDAVLSRTIDESSEPGRWTYL